MLHLIWLQLTRRSGKYFNMISMEEGARGGRRRRRGGRNCGSSMSTSTQIYISLQRIRGEGTSNLAIATAFPADYHASIYFFRSCFFYFRFLFIYMYTHTHIHTYIYIYPFFFFSSFFPSSLFFFYFFFRHSVPVLFLKRIISGIGHRVMKFSLNIFSNWFRSLFFLFYFRIIQFRFHFNPFFLSIYFSLLLLLIFSYMNWTLGSEVNFFIE